MTAATAPLDRALNTTPNERTAMDTITVSAPITPPIPLAVGEIYAGLSRDSDTGAWHHLVLLPATTDKGLTWQEAIDWAKSIGGELPTRFESALLYANVRDQVDQDYWHWTSTPHASEPSWAWNQYFDGGTQNYGPKDYPYRARAVRRVPV